MSSLLQRVKDTILADFHEILDQKEKKIQLPISINTSGIARMRQKKLPNW